MSWASNRQTKRGEDQAYSLLGLLGINMNIRYGEGREGALKRLRNKINKQSREKVEIPVSSGNSTEEWRLRTREPLSTSTVLLSGDPHFAPTLTGTSYKPRPGAQNRPQRRVICFRCQQPGHYANEHCEKCGEYGHDADDLHCYTCDGFGHYANEIHCYKCGHYGHMRRDCPK